MHKQEAREKLMRLSELVRATDEVAGGGYTALADMAFLYASTHQWFLFSGGYQVGGRKARIAFEVDSNTPCTNCCHVVRLMTSRPHPAVDSHVKTAQGAVTAC